MKCLDTYALMAIAQGDSNFAKYIAEDFVLPDTTLAEFYWVLIRDFSEHIALEWIDKLKPYSKSPERDDLINAMNFRFQHRKNNISFFDAVGYVFAQKHHILFVTGDKEFRDFSGVEFIKESH